MWCLTTNGQNGGVHMVERINGLDQILPHMTTLRRLRLWWELTVNTHQHGCAIYGVRCTALPCNAHAQIADKRVWMG